MDHSFELKLDKYNQHTIPYKSAFIGHLLSISMTYVWNIQQLPVVFQHSRMVHVCVNYDNHLPNGYYFDAQTRAL